MSDEPSRVDSMMFSASSSRGIEESKSLIESSKKQQLKYFYFYKYQENNPKKNKDNLSPYEKTIQTLSHEDRIIQKNLKILLNHCETLEQFQFSVRNPNNANDIFNIVESSIEKVKASKKFSSNSYDWSGSLIILSM